MFASTFGGDWSVLAATTNRPFTAGAVTVGESTVTLSLFPYITDYTGILNGELTFEDAVADDLMDGKVVQLSTVIANTLTTSPDEYGKKMLDTVGTFYLKLEKEACKCTCRADAFSFGTEYTPPETYSLTFSNTATLPNGPRGWQQLAPLIGRYAGFLPPADVAGRSGCQDAMDRFASPIVMRRVIGSTLEYMSDPIQIRPCTRVVYRFVHCGPALYASTYYADSVSGQGGHPSSAAYAPFPPCSWEAAGYSETPESYASHVYSHVYNFGGFATVTPGGDYAPEQQLLCGGTSDDKFSLQEGCNGTKCPPAELVATITGAESVVSFMNGTYSLGLFSNSCVSRAQPNGNYFGGTRTTYNHTSTKSLGSGITTRISINVIRASSGIDFDECGCDSRPVLATVSYFSYTTDPLVGDAGGTNAIQAAGGCRAICLEPGTSVTWPSLGGSRRSSTGTQLLNFGSMTVTVT